MCRSTRRKSTGRLGLRPHRREPEPEPSFEKSTVAEAVAVDVNADTINYEAKWAPMGAMTFALGSSCMSGAL